MQPNEDDMARLWDMLDAVRAIQMCLQNRTYYNDILNVACATGCTRGLPRVGVLADLIRVGKKPNLPTLRILL